MPAAVRALASAAISLISDFYREPVLVPEALAEAIRIQHLRMGNDNFLRS